MLGLLLLNAEAEAPVAEQRPDQRELHGYTLEDEYHWLKDKSRSKPAVLEYLAQENKYTDMMMSGTAGLQDSLYSEFRSRVPEEDSSVPYRMGNYWYYSREEKGTQYSIYCRRYQELTAPEEIYLDQNELAYYQYADFFR
jgi:oligopeptidase B